MSEEILTGGDELFFHPSVLEFFRSLINEWRSEKRVALLLGCTEHKPYSDSFMHRKVIRMLERHGLDSEVQQYIIGEPLVAVPREWERRYPASHYDFPPERMGEGGRRVFIERLNLFFRKAVKMHDLFVVFAPNHHREIIFESIKGLASPATVPYNLYKLPSLLEVLRKAVYEVRNIKGR